LDEERVRVRQTISFAVAMLIAAAVALGAEPVRDWRNIRTGREIPSEGYADQPYVVIMRGGEWLCTLTTGKGAEGQKGQHVVSTTSKDRGKTWTPLVDIEPADGPEASWAIPYVNYYGRVFVFYTYNGDRVRTLRGVPIRADILGWYCYRTSDDRGRSWSKERFRLPMPRAACDRTNDWQGEAQLFWGVSKPVRVGSRVMFSFTRLGKYMLEKGEGWLYVSDDVYLQRESMRPTWRLLPEGGGGIRSAELGSVQEEHVLAAISAHRLVCAFRTTTGYAACSRSIDGGRTWTEPERMTYAPGGRPVKNPRANVKIWRSVYGRFLLWYHNHGGKDYDGRNPAWLAGGIEKDGRIHWSQPEIVLYDPEPKTRISYPDFVEEEGRFYITETQKTVARVHEIDRLAVHGLWSQFEHKYVATGGLVLDLRGNKCGPGATATLPALPDLSTGRGFSVGFWVRFDDLAGGQTILDTRAARGKGLAIETTAKGTVGLSMSDGASRVKADCDLGVLTAGVWHHVVITVDGGPKMITWVVDGVLCDGGETRACGWTRFPASLGDVNGNRDVSLGLNLHGRLGGLRIYNRYLRTSEAVGNFRAGRG
jgi:hypothetical protein